MPDCCKRAHTPAEARELVAHAHRLSFTTFAPPGYPEQPLGLFRPPNPQEWQMHASLLHAFKREPPSCPAGGDDRGRGSQSACLAGHALLNTIRSAALLAGSEAALMPSASVCCCQRSRQLPWMQLGLLKSLNLVLLCRQA